ncbi:3-hydroxyacyl-ACP dehydratase FabZ family protein [Flagellimonas flava]|uniref:3-hydroxyacyl-ACP dehydratase FabZ family protein n=1 Tax=Flagellimonas flava TaxID=570519 RepID=UPI003D65FE7A
MTYQDILDHLPYSPPFHFVDELQHVDSNGVEGSCLFKPDSYFYQGHFKGNPVTPGVILTECCAQIGLVCLGIHLMGQEGLDGGFKSLQVAFSSSEMEFLLPVFPGETVRVISKKEYFRFNKLKCKVQMFNAKEEMVCKGTLAGMIKMAEHGG